MLGCNNSEPPVLENYTGELLIWLHQGVDATEFVAGFNMGILTPKELIAEHWNIWLFDVKATKPLDELLNILEQDSSVRAVSTNQGGIELR